MTWILVKAILLLVYVIGLFWFYGVIGDRHDPNSSTWLYKVLCWITIALWPVILLAGILTNLRGKRA